MKITGRPGEWMDHAACRRVDPETMFPNNRGELELAQQICADCPVDLECVLFAQRTREMTPDLVLYGVWGGVETARHHNHRRNRKS